MRIGSTPKSGETQTTPSGNVAPSFSGRGGGGEGGGGGGEYLTMDGSLSGYRISRDRSLCCSILQESQLCRVL